MKQRKWVFHPILASAGFVLPVALVNVANAEPSTDASAPKSEAAAPAPTTDAGAKMDAKTAPKADEPQGEAAAAAASEKSGDAASSTAGDTPTAPDVSAAPSPTAEATESYVVQPGDTLGDIARERLGSVDQWRRIAELNGIDDPATLAVGTHLELPVN